MCCADNEDRKSEIEQAHKKKDSPEWVEELASDSESIVCTCRCLAMRAGRG